MPTYDEDAYTADLKKVSDLMRKMSKCFPGYPRMVILMACSRSIAAMLGPTTDKSRDDFLQRLPDYIRSMLRAMDAEIPRPGEP